ncbi:uncharacterized protein LOC113210142 isoform X1 [Frankliniella occidentalis]|uniref:Uncharacterized protein LOC113210142 isoform X1 n=1 Tax=Frankliniella occidentalis TaxID=133901 RepID=A0A6J1SWQ2_FRAOC|nr:uncharacterized protein LOC113210142 isoform X1 [Frankliniella occidentalis]
MQATNMEMMETHPGDQIEKNMEYINSFGYKIVQNMASERKLPANLKKLEMARLIALHNAGARVELNNLLSDLKETRSRTRRLALTHAASTPMPGYGTTTAEADSASASPDQEDDDDEYAFDEDDDDDFIDKAKKASRLPRSGPAQPRTTAVRRSSHGYDVASPSPPPTSAVNQAQGMVPGVMPSGHLANTGGPGLPGPSALGGPPGLTGPSGLAGPAGLAGSEGHIVGHLGTQAMQGPEDAPKPRKPTYRRPSAGSSGLGAANKRVSKGGRVIKPRRDGSFVYPKMTHLQNSLPYQSVHAPSPGFSQSVPGETTSYDTPHVPPAASGFRAPPPYTPAVPIGSSLASSASLKPWSASGGVPQQALPSPHSSTNLYPRNSIPAGPIGKLGVHSQPSPYSPVLPGFAKAAQIQCPPRPTQNAQRNVYNSYPTMMQNSEYKTNNIVNPSLAYPPSHFQKGSDFSYLPNQDIPSSRLVGIESAQRNSANTYPPSQPVGPFESNSETYRQMSSPYPRSHIGPETMIHSQVVKPIPLPLPVMPTRECPPSGYISGNLEYLFNLKSEHLQMPLQLSPYWKPAKTNCVSSYNTPICFTGSSPGLYQEASHTIPHPLITSGPCYEDSPFQPLLRTNIGLPQPPSYDYPTNLNFEVPSINFQAHNQPKQYFSESQIPNHVPTQYEMPQHMSTTYQEPFQYQQSPLSSNIEQYSSHPIHGSYQEQNSWALSEQVTQTWTHDRDDPKYRPSVQLHQHELMRRPHKQVQHPMQSKQTVQRKKQTQPYGYPQQTARQGNAHIQEKRGTYQTNHQSQPLASIGKQDIEKSAGGYVLNQQNEAQKQRRNLSTFQQSTEQNIQSYNQPSQQKPSPIVPQTALFPGQGPPLKKPCYQSSKTTLQDSAVSPQPCKLSSPKQIVQKPCLSASTTTERPQLPFSEFRGQNNQLSLPLIYDYLTSAEKQMVPSPKESQNNFTDSSTSYDLNGNISSSFIEDVLPTLSQHALNSKIQDLVYQHRADELETSAHSTVSENYSDQRICQSLQVHTVSSLPSKSKMSNVSPDSSEQEPQPIEMSSIGLHFEADKSDKQVYAELSPLKVDVNDNNFGSSTYAQLVPVPFESNHVEECGSQAHQIANVEQSLHPEAFKEGIALSGTKKIDTTLEKVMKTDGNSKQVVFLCSDGTGELEYMTLDVTQEDTMDTSVGSLPGTIPASPCTSDVGELNLLDSIEENGKHSTQFLSNGSSHISQVSTIPVTHSDLSTETASSISDYLSTNSPPQVTSDADYLSTKSELVINTENILSTDSPDPMTTNSNYFSAEQVPMVAHKSIGMSNDAMEVLPLGGEIHLADNTSAVQLPISPNGNDNVVPSVSEPLMQTKNSEMQHEVPSILREATGSSGESGSLRNVPSGSEFLECSKINTEGSGANETSGKVLQVEDGTEIASTSIIPDVPELLKIMKTETIDIIENKEYLENYATAEPQSDDQMNVLTEQPLDLNADCSNIASDCAQNLKKGSGQEKKDEPVNLTKDQSSNLSVETEINNLPLGEENSTTTCATSTDSSEENISITSKSTDVNMNVIREGSDNAVVLEMDSCSASPLLRGKSAGKTYPGKQVRQPVRCSPRTSGRPSPSYAFPTTNFPLRLESPARGRKPCPNEENGCPIELPSAQLSSHHLVCEYTSIECPAIGCEWNCITKKLCTHIRETHRSAIGAGTDSRHTVSVHQIHQQQRLTFLREVSRKLFVVCIHAYGNDIYASIQYIASGRAEKPISATGTLEVIDFVGTPHAWRGMIGPIQQGLKFLRDSGNCLQVTSQCLGAIPDSTITFHTNIRVNHAQHAAASASSSNSDPLS